MNDSECPVCYGDCGTNPKFPCAHGTCAPCEFELRRHAYRVPLCPLCRAALPPRVPAAAPAAAAPAVPRAAQELAFLQALFPLMGIAQWRVTFGPAGEVHLHMGAPAAPVAAAAPAAPVAVPAPHRPTRLEREAAVRAAGGGEALDAYRQRELARAIARQARGTKCGVRSCTARGEGVRLRQVGDTRLHRCDAHATVGKYGH